MATAVTSGAALSDHEIDKVAMVEELFNLANRHLRRRHEWWKKAYRLVHNRSWASGRDPDAPIASASEIYPILAALVGWMTDQRPVFDVQGICDPHSQYAEFIQGLARDLEKALLSVWMNHNLEAQVEKVLWDALIYGTGFIKVTWDPGADDGAGNPDMRRVDPFTMFPDPNATDEFDANFLIEARRMSLDELERRYPDKARLVLDAPDESDKLPRRDDIFAISGKPPMANTGGVAGGKPVYGLPGQTNRLRAGELDDRSVTVFECWVKENIAKEDEDGERFYVPQWKVYVVAGGRLLMEERAVDLWAHGSHPYRRYVSHDMGDFWGVSLVDHLAAPQLSVNRLLVAMQSHAELCGNPILLEDARSGIPRTKIVNKPGQRLVKNAGSEVGWLVPPDMAQSVPNLVTFWINEMERISGLSAIVRGATPTGRNAQGVIDSVQESAFVRVRLALRSLERTLSEAGRLMAHLIVENYTLPRTVAIAGPSGEKSMLALKARHFYAPNFMGADPMKFALNIRMGSALPLSRSARAQEADTLFAMGAIDHQAVLEAHDFPNRREILERVNAMMGMGIQPGAQRVRNRP